MDPALGILGVVLVGAALSVGTSTNANAQTAPPYPFGALSALLSPYGIVPNASYTGEFATNPSGGEHQGGAFAGQLAIGADVDMQKLMGVNGGTMQIEFTDRSGRDLSNDSINNSVSVQEIYGGGQTYNLTTLTYDQKLFGGLVDVLAGRTEIDQVALTDPIYCNFESNAICGQPDIMGKIINASFYPVAVWGGRVKIAPTPKTYFSFGLYDSDPADDVPNNHGFDWSVAHSQGVLIPVEAGYQTTFANDDHPRRYNVGAVFDRTPYGFTTYDATTKQLGSTNGYGRTMLYAQAKQMVFRPDMSSQRGLTLFGAFVLGPDAHQPVDYDVTVGGTYLGPLTQRPADILGIAIGDTHYRNSFIDQFSAYRTEVLGSGQRPANELIMTEINYDFAVTPWMNVTPNFQYIVNPDGSGGLPYPKANLPNAFVLGLKFSVVFQ
jgi:porin